MTASSPSNRSHVDIRDAGPALGLVVVAAVVGQIAILPNLPWYHSLTPPSFAPPDWLFGVAWTLLYAMMAYASYRVLSLRQLSAARSIALALYLLALLFDILWPFAFFASHDLALGLAAIVPELALLLSTVLAFGRLDRMAGLAMAPPLVWVAFATALNFEYWRLN